MSEREQQDAALRQRAMADLTVSLERMRAKGRVRDHFHAGAMAALNAINAHDTPEERVASIQSAMEAYADRVTR